MSRKAIPALLLTAAAFTITAPTLSAQGARQPVIPAGQSASPTLTPGIRAGNLVFASGQLGLNREAPDTTIGGQTKLALENTKKVFEAAGTTMANAVKCTVFLTELKDFAGMNAAYREFFPTSPPARSTVVVAALVAAGAKVEIECIAAIP
jgi:2-iminobutanoate/2-iminopropanoate deaminase